jgi:voltage-gated potassium channel
VAPAHGRAEAASPDPQWPTAPPLRLPGVDLAGWENIERRHVVLTVVRVIATSVLVLSVYFLVPISDHPHGSIIVRLSVGLALFAAILAYEVRAILKSDRPMLRATDAMALVIPIFVVVFAWTYLTMAKSAPLSFTQPLDRVGALYFTVTVLTTVGFGDIAARTQGARLAVTAQMVCDVIVIAVVVRLIFEAARGTLKPSADDSQ